MFSPDGISISASAAPHCGVTSGLRPVRETFIKRRYIVARTNKAEIRPEEQVEKAESCWEKLWNEIQLKGHKERNTQEENKKRSGQARLVYVRHKP